MTIQDEARELLADVRRAEDALTAIRREIDEVVADRGGHCDVETAEAFRHRLEGAQQRLHEARKALRDLNPNCRPG